MKIFGFNISRGEPAPAKAAEPRSFSPAAAAWLRGEDLDRGGAVLSNAYQQVVWVYRAINVLAEQVANVPFVFSAGERGRENLITSGPLLDFYLRPHPQIDRFQYWELRVLWLLLRGECFRIPIYSSDLNPNHDPNLDHNRSALAACSDTPHAARLASPPPPRRRLERVVLLDPAHFQHIVEDHELLGWRYTGFGRQTPLASQVFLPEEVWFEKLPNPFDFWRGMSPLQVAGMAARTDFVASAFMQGLIENNADLGVVVRTNEHLNDEQRQQVIAELQGRKRRAGTADRPLLLWAGTDVVKPQVSSSDLQFLENRKFSRAEICAAFGVPEEIVTTTDHSKYDVMAGARLNFIENRVAPLCSRLEAAEEVTVKSIDPGATGWFDLDSLPIMENARRDRLAAARKAFEMGIPFNELNRVLDLGFQALPWGDRGYLSSKFQEIQDSPRSTVHSPQSEGGDSPKFNVQKGKVGKWVSEKVGWERRIYPAGRGAVQSPESDVQSPKSEDEEQGSNSSDWVERLMRMLDEVNARGDEPYAARLALKERKLSRFFFEQRGRVLAKLTEVLSHVGPSGTLGPVLDLATENHKLADALQPLVAEDWAVAVKRTRGGAESFDRQLAPAAVDKHLAGREPELSAINQATCTALEQTLQQGRGAGETHPVLAERVRALFNQISARRIHEIALAESLAAFAAGRECARKFIESSKATPTNQPS